MQYWYYNTGPYGKQKQADNLSVSWVEYYDTENLNRDFDSEIFNDWRQIENWGKGEKLSAHCMSRNHFVKLQH